MSILDDYPPHGPPRSEDAALAELTRRLAQLEEFADGLRETLPWGDRREVAGWVRAQLLAIMNGKVT